MNSRCNQPLKANSPKRVIFTMGGKGGTGKTTFIASLCEFYDRVHTAYDLVDLDAENKVHGSLSHFFPRARKIDPSGETGLDVYLEILNKDIDVLVADMGAGQGDLTYKWFDSMYSQVCELGYRLHFTAVGVITYDSSTVESVLNWSARLQKTVDYMLVKNNVRDGLGFPGLELAHAKAFVEAFDPAVVTMPLRVGEYERLARMHGLTPGAIAEGRTDVPELRRVGLQIRAAGYRASIENQLQEFKHLLLAPELAAA